MKCTRSILIWLLVGCCIPTLQAQQRHSFRICFLTGEFAVDTLYGDNPQVIRSMLEALDTIRQHPRLTLKSISLTGSASPEGNHRGNQRLALWRQLALKDFLIQHTPLSPHLFRLDTSDYISWSQFADAVTASQLPQRQELLEIIGSTDSTPRKAERLAAISTSSHGRQLRRKIFPLLRNATAHLNVVEVYPPVGLRPVFSTMLLKEALPITHPTATTPPPPFYMAVKTNLLYDALLVPNLGIEFYLGRHWSLSGNWQYAWWSSNRHHRYWRTYGGEFALRKWVGRRSRSKPLTGHHVGIYGQLLTYDFEWGGRGYLADNWNYAAGIEYGYALPVGRRLNLDFVIGIGYGGGTCEEYRPRNCCYIRQVVRDRHWIGPTKAEISLVWLIGRGNTNQFNQK